MADTLDFLRYCFYAQLAIDTLLLTGLAIFWFVVHHLIKKEQEFEQTIRTIKYEQDIAERFREEGRVGNTCRVDGRGDAGVRG